MSSDATSEGSARPPRFVLGTPLESTSYEDFTLRAQLLAKKPGPTAVDFTNTQIVTMRRHERWFREITGCFDYFVPDATPLIWCFRLQRERQATRTYGPWFMRHCILNSPPSITHYFLGASEHCLEQLRKNLLAQNPAIKIVGWRNGYFQVSEEQDIVDEINSLAPDFVWVGLGTPKQQDWIRRNKPRIRRGVLFAVGFAFDVNAGTKPDAPEWMHRAGLTWLYRMLSEPRRLIPRYLKYNTLFLAYLAWDGIRGRAWKGSPLLGI